MLKTREKLCNTIQQKHLSAQSHIPLFPVEYLSSLILWVLYTMSQPKYSYSLLRLSSSFICYKIKIIKLIKLLRKIDELHQTK